MLELNYSQIIQRNKKNGMQGIMFKDLIDVKTAAKHKIDCIQTAQKCNLSLTHVYNEMPIYEVIELLAICLAMEFQEIPPEQPHGRGNFRY